MGNVEGKVVVVTGAGRGLGRTMAQALIQGGAKVALLDIDGGAAARSAEALGTADRAYASVCDVRSPKDAVSAVESIIARYGRIDALVNNAGLTVQTRAETLAIEDWQRVLEVNLTGTFVMSQAVGCVMIAQGAGSIINIGSIHAAVAPAFHQACAYAASKSGVLGLTRALAVEWGRHGIRVNAVCPGYMRTEMTKARLADPEYSGGIIERTPLGRIGDPEDLVGAICFLASDASSFVTGHALSVDGGWLAI